MISTDPAEVFDELARASAGGPADYSGISHARLDRGEELFWPCPSRTRPGTPRVFLDRFATPDGRARFLPVDHRPVADDLTPQAPLYLVTGRVLEHYQSGAQTRRVPDLVAACPEPFAELHPDTAARLGIEDGAPVRLSGRRGDLTVPARLTPTVRPDTVFVPFHWSGAGRVNTLTNDAVDPVSGMPEFKVCAVDVRPLLPVPVGAGPTAAHEHPRTEPPGRLTRPRGSTEGRGSA